MLECGWGRVWSSGNFEQWDLLDVSHLTFWGDRCAGWKLAPLYGEGGLTRRVSFTLTPRVTPSMFGCPLVGQARHHGGK